MSFMYLGFYISKLTSKNQLTLPLRLKENFGKRILITYWFENSLIILPFEKGEEVLTRVIEEASSLLPEARDLSRFFFSNAQVVTLDVKSRFVLPKELKEYAGIGSNAIFLGVNDRIELWDKKMYENYGKIREVQIRETAINHYNRIVNKK